LRRTLEELPKSLDETYKRILNQINNANQAHAYRLLQCLAVALRPLRLEELAEVLAFDLTTSGIPKLNTDWRWEDQEAVLSTCSSLVSIVVDDGSRVVQFSHFTVKEFLTSDRLATCMEEVSEFHIPIEPSHAILARACLGVLICLDDHTDKDSAENIPLYRYAAEYWIEHARVGDVELQIKDALDYFFDMDNPHFSALVRIKYPNNLLRVSGDEPPTGVPRPAAPLYFAAWQGLRGLVGRLVFQDLQQINHFGGRFGTPFHASVVGGHIEVSQLLFAHGADIDSRCSDNWTPLHDASRLGHVEIVKWLLNHGADVHSQEKRGRTPLYVAASHGDLAACRILIEHHAEVDARSNSGSTPFLKALEYGHRDVARLLLDHNADVRVHGTDGNTPLHFAAYYGHLEVCRILLERNVEVDSRNKHGYTPFFRAWKSGRNPDILQLFLDYHADVRVYDDNGNTPLHFAAEIGNLKLAQILLGRNADVNSQNNHGSTSLLLASELGHSDVVQLLLDHNADLYLRDADGDTPLHCAAIGGLEVARILLKLNVEVNSRNVKGSTPLHLASIGSWRLPEGSAVVVQFLLDHGADVQARDLSGKTASEVARGPGREEIIRLLSQRTAAE
jgi:ankyrin repeat protein